jgi:hypothetical protein
MHPGRLPPITPGELGAGPSTPEPLVTAGGGRRSVSAGGWTALEPAEASLRSFTPGSVLRPGVVALPGSVVSPGRLNVPVEGIAGLPVVTPGVPGAAPGVVGAAPGDIGVGVMGCGVVESCAYASGVAASAAAMKAFFSMEDLLCMNEVLRFRRNLHARLLTLPLRIITMRALLTGSAVNRRSRNRFMGTDMRNDMQLTTFLQRTSDRRSSSIALCEAPSRAPGTEEAF